MKRILFALTLSLLLLNACKKDSPAIDEEKTQVNFTVSTFDVSSRPFPKMAATISAPGDTLKNHILFLECVVFDANEKLVQRMRQSAETPGFGKLSLRLKPGKYTFAFIGRQIHYPTVFNPTETYQDLIILQNGPTDDIFLQTLTVTVTEAPVTQSVRLERIVGALEITIQDPIPLDVHFIQVHIGNEGFYSVKSRTMWRTFPDSTPFEIPVEDRGKANYKLFLYRLNTHSPLRVDIESRSTSGKTYPRKVISNVQCYPNEVTKLTGNLYQ